MSKTSSWGRLEGQILLVESLRDKAQEEGAKRGLKLTRQLVLSQWMIVACARAMRHPGLTWRTVLRGRCDRHRLHGPAVQIGRAHV